MNGLAATIACFHFSQGTPATLEQQPDDHRSLKQDGCDNGGHVPAILFPQGRRAKPYFAPRWQPRLADAQSSQLAPIKHWSLNVPHRDGNVGGILAAEDAQCSFSCRFAAQSGPPKEAASSAKSKPHFRVDHDRPVGYRGDGRERNLSGVVHWRTATPNTRINDCRIRRQDTHLPDQITQRQSGEIDEFQFSGNSRELLQIRTLETLALWRIPDHCNSFKLRYQRSCCR